MHTANKSGVSTAMLLIIALVGICAGSLLVAYPLISTRVNNYEQGRIARDSGKIWDALSASDQAERLAEAEAYNLQLTHNEVTDPWQGQPDQSSPEYMHYARILGKDAPMGQLVIPAIQVNLPIYHGTSDIALGRGIGHLFGTALPIGGIDTHTVLTGHSGLSRATMLDNAEQLVEGDAIYVKIAGRELKYQVARTQIVLPEETDSLAQVPGHDLMTLITCTPYGVNTHRLLVHAVRVDMEASETPVFDQKTFIWQWWMFVAVFIIFLAGAALIWIIVQYRKSYRKDKHQSDS